MKNLKIAVSALLLVASATLVIAQDQPQQRGQRERQTAEQRAESTTKQLVEKLKLSDEQSEKVLSINLANFQKVDSLMGTQSETKREDMMKLMESNTATIKTVLTDEQLAAYEKMLEEQAKARQERSNGDRPQRGSGGGTR